MVCTVTDIDECLNNNGGCSHDCINTVGSYNCECPTGHDLRPNNHDCEGECCIWLYSICNWLNIYLRIPVVGTVVAIIMFQH